MDDLREVAEFRTVMRQLGSAYVSDARWPPAPTSPGRFNVEEALQALEAANDGLGGIMDARGLGSHVTLYSPDLMRTQIAAVRDELMALPYFEEANG